MKKLFPGTLLQDLRSQKLRLFLTLFGIFWGTFAVVVLLAFGTGLERKAEEEMSGGSGVVTLRSGLTREPWRGLPAERRIQLHAADAMLLRREVPEIGMLSEASAFRATTRVGEQSAESYVMGVEPEYAPLMELDVTAQGRFVNRPDLEQRRRTAVIGSGVVLQLFGNPDADVTGQQIQIGNSLFTIVGILQRREGSRGFLNDERIFIPATTYRVLNRTSVIQSIVYAPTSPDVAPAALQRAFDLIGARHRFDPTDRRALAQWDAGEFEQEIRFFLLALKIFLAVVGGFTLLVGGIGVANIMFVVVRERRVEIGVKRAIGARRSHILLQFMAEAAMLVGLGALGGFVFAALVVKLAGLIPATEEMGQPVISAGVALLTASVLALVALAAGVFPARQAARLDPATCIRG